MLRLVVVGLAETLAKDHCAAVRHPIRPSPVQRGSHSNPLVTIRGDIDILNSLPTDRAAVVAMGFLSPECQALAEQSARKLEEKTADAPTRSPMPAVKAEQERQARAAAEAETKPRAEQQAEAQRLPAPRADQERRASAAAEAEMKPRAEQQRLSLLGPSRNARQARRQRLKQSARRTRLSDNG